MLDTMGMAISVSATEKSRNMHQNKKTFAFLFRIYKFKNEFAAIVHFGCCSFVLLSQLIILHADYWNENSVYLS